MTHIGRYACACNGGRNIMMVSSHLLSEFNVSFIKEMNAWYYNCSLEPKAEKFISPRNEVYSYFANCTEN